MEDGSSPIRLYGYRTLTAGNQLSLPKDARADLGLPDGKLKVLVFGHVERSQIFAMPDPGPEALLDAAAELHARAKADS